MYVNDSACYVKRIFAFKTKNIGIFNMPLTSPTSIFFFLIIKIDLSKFTTKKTRTFITTYWYDSLRTRSANNYILRRTTPLNVSASIPVSGAAISSVLRALRVGRTPCSSAHVRSRTAEIAGKNKIKIRSRYVRVVRILVYFCFFFCIIKTAIAFRPSVLLFAHGVSASGLPK